MMKGRFALIADGIDFNVATDQGVNDFFMASLDGCYQDCVALFVWYINIGASFQKN